MSGSSQSRCPRRVGESSPLCFQSCGYVSLSKSYGALQIICSEVVQDGSHYRLLPLVITKDGFLVSFQNAARSCEMAVRYDGTCGTRAEAPNCDIKVFERFELFGSSMKSCERMQLEDEPQ